MAGRMGARALERRRSWARGSPWRAWSSRRWKPAAPAFSGVVVAEILTAEQHPQADKLRVCRVSSGQGEPLQIVCGAANARAGLKSALAVVGAKLPGDLAIKAAKLRGVESAGMLCSAKELGLADASSGIVELPSDAPVGKDLRDYLALDEMILELNVTPNRGDAMSVHRCRARGGGAVRRAGERAPAQRPARPAAALRDTFGVHLDAPAGCPKFVGRIVRGVNNKCRHSRLDAGAFAACGCAFHQPSGGRHQLRDARAGPADARL